MDKLEKYQKILQSLISEYANYKPSYTSNEWLPIGDDVRGEYLLLKINAVNNTHHSIFHFRLDNGKVLVVNNNTDLDIEKQLIEFGIAPEDIAVPSTLEPRSSDKLVAA